MTPSYIIDEMENEWQKAVAHTENFMQTIKHAPFSEHIKEMIIAALKCNITLLEQNENLIQRINKLEGEAE